MFRCETKTVGTCTRQLSQPEYQFQHIYKPINMAELLSLIFQQSVGQLKSYNYVYVLYTSKHPREASGIIIMLVIILIHLLVPGEITNLNY